MCDLGVTKRVKCIGSSSIGGWRIMQVYKKGDGGQSLYSVYRSLNTKYILGCKCDARDLDSVPYRKVSEASDEDFYREDYGFWCFKTRKLAREWKRGKIRSFKKLRLVKVQMLERVVEHEFGYRAQAIIPLAIVS